MRFERLPMSSPAGGSRRHGRTTPRSERASYFMAQKFGNMANVTQRARPGQSGATSDGSES
eukprot:939315-Pyramimonas_sp.AAC.1